jgi:hypothetical protein
VKLTGAPDGTVDRLDRALWLTLPFDIAWYIISVPACRVYAVSADDRLFVMPADDRTCEVGAEDRLFAVAFEDRAYEVPAEDRTFEVMCG